MRGLIVTTEFPPGPGGIGTHAWELARNLTRAGWTLEVLARQAYRDAGEIDVFNRQQSFPVLRLPRGPLAARSLLAQSTQRTRPDVVIGTGRSGVWLVSATRGSGRSVAVCHGSELTVGTWPHRKLTGIAFERVDSVVCVSRYTRNRLEECGISTRSLTVIPNGADHARFHPLPAGETERSRGRYGLPKGPVLLTVGHLSPRKGQDIVIRALPAVIRTIPDAQYVLAGLPSEGSHLEELASELGVSDHVHILGGVPDSQLNALYNLCDVFVMTSRSVQGDFEGYGIAAVEAALAAKPAVVSSNSGLQEAILDGSTGLAVPQEDPDSTAEALTRLLSDAEGRNRMATAARARALAEQTWEVAVGKYDRWFRQLVVDSP